MSPNLRVRAGATRTRAVDVTVYPVVAGAKTLPAAAETADRALQGALRGLLGAEFRGRLGEVATIHTLGALEAPRVALLGLGKAAVLDPVRLRYALQTGLRALAAKGMARVEVAWVPGLAGGMDDRSFITCVAEAGELARFNEASHRTGEPAPILRELLITGTGSETAALRQAAVLAGATNAARVLVNTPSSELTPPAFAEIARKVAAGAGLEFELLGRRELQKLGYGAILAVAAGSQYPPQMAILRHRIGRAKSAVLALALVGKGITFDSGGISIKPSEGMERMKGDMGGAAAVLGAMEAIGRLKLPVDVVGILCLAENMLDGASMRPGDVVRTGNGKTVEIINTDAEGRLVLADGIHHAVNLGAERIVDIATLTGSQRIALGPVAAALVCSDLELGDEVRAAADLAGERVWELPSYPEYETLLESPIADLVNSPGRDAGTITAGLFLRAFAAGRPWAHLDIAAPSNNFVARLSELPKGPTGFGVRTLYHLAAGLAGSRTQPAAARRGKPSRSGRK